ncbi:dehydrogenase [Halioglobus maricola]|uniref:Dehydrogenase n=1 Tax=Halioglobus maricola TaxID=2601894 RepID=A0A5P9NQW4_9GAMM|nr:Gfo/Idh/MocA family oxidoreductase [Halioglobus maricola]QFU77308.1 dehydrogenase [Halioglobus maricola]
MSDDNKKDLSRRQFIEKSSVLAGGALITGGLAGCATGSTNPAASSAVFAGGSETLKLAVIGCGGRGTGAATQAMKADKGIELVAVADAFDDQAAKCVKTLTRIFGNERIKVTPETTFAGFDAFEKAIDMADVVILATPPGFRPEHFEYAVAGNKHVFMEKPLATDAYGVRRVMKAAEQAREKKLNVVVGLQRHYQPSYLEAYKRYQEGAIGEIVSGQVYWNSDGVWVRERQPGQTELEYQMRNWYYFNWLCGDHILEQHIHNIDVANWFIGAAPVGAQGMGGRQVRAGPDHGEIFDHHFVEFTYANGAVISSQCRHQPGCANMVEERFQTTTGSLYTSGSNDATLTTRAGERLYKHSGMFDPSPYQIEHDKLFASIRSGGHIDDTPHGVEATMTAIMGRMATYSGKRVSWDKALASGQRLVPDSKDLDWNGKAPVMPDAEGSYAIPTPGKTRVL